MRRTLHDPDPKHNGAGVAGLTDEALEALVRVHASRPPYGAVHWDALGARILAAAEDEMPRGLWARTGDRTGVPLRAQTSDAIGRKWWDVAEGWARPALAAALVVGSVAGVLAMRTPATETGDASASASAWLQSVTGVGSALAERPADATAGPDSLFTAVIEQ